MVRISWGVRKEAPHQVGFQQLLRGVPPLYPFEGRRQKAAHKSAPTIGTSRNILTLLAPAFNSCLFFFLVGASKGTQVSQSVKGMECFPFGALVPRRGSWNLLKEIRRLWLKTRQISSDVGGGRLGNAGVGYGTSSLPAEKHLAFSFRIFKGSKPL